MRITKQKHAIQREPLLSPFGFKGGYLSEIWQSVSLLQSDSGAEGIGAGVQSVLWSDPNMFVRYKELQGNEMMSQVTRHALAEAQKIDFASPFELLDALLPSVYEYGKQITESNGLRLTFVLNAMVGIDQAVWSLYSQHIGQPRFADLVPEAYRGPLTCRHSQLGSIPIASYGMGEADIVQLLEEGYFILKIKTGSDPEQDGDQQKMLEWDKERLSLVHRIAQNYRTDYTEDGRIAYYIDANGRYESKDTLLRFLEHADRIGALQHIVLFEEPFAEADKADVSDVPVRVAADESVHDLNDALERIQMGYTAMALKPVAKTMSLTLKIAKLAHEKGIPCFCADLTANPLLVDWNKSLAACLAPIPGLKIGAFESNGHQNYLHWEQMKAYHPRSGSPWIEPHNGVYPLDEAFYRCSGGALEGAHSPYKAFVEG